MSTGNPIADIGIAVVSTLLGSKAMGAEAPSMPAAPEMPKPPETPKSPERDPFKQKNQQAAAAGGPASTMLTGTGGVAPSGLSLGRAGSLYDNSKLGA